MREFNGRRLLLGLALVPALALWAAPAAPAGAAQTVRRVETVASGNFDQTVQRLEVAIKSRGMMIVGEYDHQNMLRMVGATIAGSKTIEFAKPDMMKMVLGQHPEIGVEMPLRFYVYQRADGRTLVSYYPPSRNFASYGKADLKQLGGMMDKMLAAIAAEATK